LRYNNYSKKEETNHLFFFTFELFTATYIVIEVVVISVNTHFVFKKGNTSWKHCL